MPPLSILIKPASGLCNMRCRYCFYNDETDHREVASYGIMSAETAEFLVRRAFDYADGQVTFAFQGGEPTLAGVDYYRTFTSLVDRYNTKHIPVAYVLQTNGYHVPDELCELLRDRKFLVGVSLDGNSAVHDSSRRDAAGEGTFKRVNESIKKFREYGIDYNILTVVTDAVAKNISQVYNYFRSKNYKYLQFIKYIDGLDEGGETFAPSPKRYTNFLKTAFGYYYDDFVAGKYTSVREFDNFVMLAMGRPAECCGMNGVCSQTLVIEADGGAYPCDFYVLDEWRLGNIREQSVDELYATETSREFLRRSRKIHEKCRVCPYVRLCRGGCARYRESCVDGTLGEFSYCESYREFFAYAAPKITELARMAAGRIGLPK